MPKRKNYASILEAEHLHSTVIGAATTAIPYVVVTRISSFDSLMFEKRRERASERAEKHKFCGLDQVLSL